MRADGGKGDSNLFRNLLVKVSLGEQVQNFRLAGRQSGGLAPGAGRPLKRLHDLAGDVAVDRRPALMHVADRGQQIIRLRLLEQITRGARRQRVKDMLGLVIHRQHHDLCAGQQRLEPAHTLHAVQPRQVDVHQHHLGIDFRNLPQRILRRRMLAQAAKSRSAINQPDQISAHALIIFDDGNGNAHGLVILPWAGRCP